MQITKDTVAQFIYTLKDEAGNELESTEAGHPVAYLHGHDNMLEGLEKELDGKSAYPKGRTKVYISQCERGCTYL